MTKHLRDSVRDHATRSKERGLTRVNLWVPKDCVRAVRRYADKLRNAYRLFGNEAQTEETKDD